MTELQIDVHGLRTFRVSDDGNLLPVTAVDDSWRGGVCVARCRRNPNHQAPVERCRCGIYSFRNLDVLRSQYEPANFLVAVVALEGQTLAGTKGWRSQAGRVVALWIRPGALPEALTVKLSANLPGVRLYADVAEMIAGYPGLAVTSSVPPTAFAAPSTAFSAPPTAVSGAATAPRPFPLRPRPVRAHLVMWFLAELTGAAVLFLVGDERAGRPGGGSGGPLDTVLGAIGRVGIFTAAYDLVFLIPLLFVGLGLAARASTRPAAAILSAVAWSLTAAVVAAVIAAVATGNEVQFNFFAAWMVTVIGWRWVGLFLFSVGNADGPIGYIARVVLRAAAAARRALRPGKPATGVEYRPRPDHRPGRYPLLVPVHLQLWPIDRGEAGYY